MPETVEEEPQLSEEQLQWQRADHARMTMPLERKNLTGEGKSFSENALERRTMPANMRPPKSFQDRRQQLDELDEIAEGTLA